MLTGLLMSSGFMIFLKVEIKPSWLSFLEDGGLGSWSSTNNPDGNEIFACPPAGYSGTYGLQIDIDDTDDVYVRDDTPSAATRHHVRFAFNPDSVVMGSTESFRVLLFGNSETPYSPLIVNLYKGTGYELNLSAVKDDS